MGELQYIEPFYTILIFIFTTPKRRPFGSWLPGAILSWRFVVKMRQRGPTPRSGRRAEEWWKPFCCGFGLRLHRDHCERNFMFSFNQFYDMILGMAQDHLKPIIFPYFFGENYGLHCVLRGKTHRGWCLAVNPEFWGEHPTKPLREPV